MLFYRVREDVLCGLMTMKPLAYGKDGFANPFFIAYSPDVELKDA